MKSHITWNSTSCHIETQSAPFSSPSASAIWNKTLANGKSKSSLDVMSSLAFEVHRDVILDLAFLQFPQNLIITASRDGVVKVWK